ncbi:MAG TPA: GNAT family protein [Cryptosporangiaceae bacterium]|nr:GNAT family protein [Cryptosporangiaceae bacterium]
MLRPEYPIVTARLLLRPFGGDDLDDLYAYQSRPDVVRYLYWQLRDRAQSAEALGQKIRQAAIEEPGESLVLAVVRPEIGRVIGEVNLMWRSRDHRQGEFGFVLHPDHQGSGLATEAARVMLDLGFGRLGLHRIEGRCDVRNTPSVRLMERLGMRREAHFVHNEMFKGEWGDEYVYAMLDDEWTPGG